MSNLLLENEECEVYVADNEFDIVESQKKLDEFLTSKGTKICLDELAYVLLLIRSSGLFTPASTREEFRLGRELHNCWALAVFVHTEWKEYNTMNADELEIAKEKLCNKKK